MNQTGNSYYDVIVIGGGAAGLMAAGQASTLGAKTLLLEKMERPARKLRITGKGRCNLTNIAPLPEFLSHFHPNEKFLRQSFSRFFSEDLVEFFESIGVKTMVERGGRVFPKSERAHDVADALVRWNFKYGVELKNRVKAGKLLIENQKCYGVQATGQRVGIKGEYQTYHANAVIIATGGKSYPATGSTGDGYKLAAVAGHTIVPLRPSLVPLKTNDDIARKLQGLSLRNVNVSVWYDGKKQVDAFGEMLFTHFGLSGPIILTLSRIIVDAMYRDKQVKVSIDMKPGLTDQQLDTRLLRDFEMYGKRQFDTYLKMLLPQKMIPVCLEIIRIPSDKKCNQVTSGERKKLRAWLKDFQVTINGHRSYTEAIITAGGVSTNEIDPYTMESRMVKGLFFAGEIIDFDADTGGYNLQAAFSTGWVAGNSAAQNR